MGKEQVLAFIKKQELAVISSINEKGQPEAAVIGFGETDDFELIFGTSNLSRKYKNIIANPKVALVIGWDEGITVQYEGEASELEGEELETFKNVYFTKNPDARKYEEEPDEAYFKVSPTWVRYTDLNQEPWELIEIISF
jgi:uncharacterized protein YhbP (UPF0306 family)